MSRLSPVVTLLINNKSPNIATVKKYWDPIYKKAGVKKLAYVPERPPPTRLEWPTLREMIEMQKRLVVFMDEGANTARAPYILPEFKHVSNDSLIYFPHSHVSGRMIDLGRPVFSNEVYREVCR